MRILLCDYSNPFTNLYHIVAWLSTPPSTATNCYTKYSHRVRPVGVFYRNQSCTRGGHASFDFAFICSSFCFRFREGVFAIARNNVIMKIRKKAHSEMAYNKKSPKCAKPPQLYLYTPKYENTTQINWNTRSAIQFVRRLLFQQNTMQPI